MTVNQTNKREMYGRVISMINQHIVFFAGVSAFSASFEKFLEVVEGIDTAAEDKTGDLRMRDASEETMINYLMDIAAALHAYAAKSKLPDIKAATTFTRAEIEHLSIEALGQTGKLIAEIAKRYAPFLAAHGIDEIKISKLDSSLQKFLSADASYRSGYKGKEISLRDLFQKADAILTLQLDTIVGTLKRKHGEFFQEYQSKRTLYLAADRNLAAAPEYAVSHSS